MMGLRLLALLAASLGSRDADRAARTLATLNATWLEESVARGERFLLRGGDGAAAPDVGGLLRALLRPFRDPEHRREPFASLRGDGGAAYRGGDASAAVARLVAGGGVAGASAVLRLEALASAPGAAEALARLLPRTVYDPDRGDTAHVYASSPGAAALANHTDVTDVLVVQLRGSKTWRVCGRAQAAFTHGELDRCAAYGASEMAAVADCEAATLSPGDALYVPRRSIHSARATDDAPSTHLTLGLAAPCADGGAARARAYGLGRRRRRLTVCDSGASACPANHYSSSGSYAGSSCDSCDDSSCDFIGMSCDRSCMEDNYECDGDESCDSSCDLCSGCAACAAGKYRDAGSATCADCAAGAISAAGGSCVSCAAGTAAAAAGSATCDPCEAGTYSAVGAATCEYCAPGSYSLAGASQCESCVAGRYAFAGSPTCADCPAGSYADEAGASLCADCPAGSYADEAGASTCAVCDPGRFTNAGGTTCYDCPPYTYAPLAGADDCATCPDGASSYGGAVACTCPAGEYVDEDADACAPCPSGRFSSEADSDTECAPCAAGSHANDEGATACDACGAGTWAPVAGLSSCFDCDAGSSSAAGASSCEACLPNTFAAAAGDLCEACDANWMSHAGATECFPDPTACPSSAPTAAPSRAPTAAPSASPTARPSAGPSPWPTPSPTTSEPSLPPSPAPSVGVRVVAERALFEPGPGIKPVPLAKGPPVPDQASFDRCQEGRVEASRRERDAAVEGKRAAIRRARRAKRELKLAREYNEALARYAGEHRGGTARRRRRAGGGGDSVAAVAAELLRDDRDALRAARARLREERDGARDREARLEKDLEDARAALERSAAIGDVGGPPPHWAVAAREGAKLENANLEREAAAARRDREAATEAAAASKQLARDAKDRCDVYENAQGRLEAALQRSERRGAASRAENERRFHETLESDARRKADADYERYRARWNRAADLRSKDRVARTAAAVAVVQRLARPWLARRKSRRARDGKLSIFFAVRRIVRLQRQRKRRRELVPAALAVQRVCRGRLLRPATTKAAAGAERLALA